MMQFRSIAQFFPKRFFLNLKPGLSCLGFFLYSSILFPSTSSYQLSKSYDLISIADSFTWTRLMDQKNLNQESKSFFVYHHEENFDYRKELLASLEILLSKDKKKSLNFQCRFPARTLYLQSIIHEIPKLKVENCPKYFAWTQNNSIEGISFVFVNGYLENPASFFGHTLLKFNSTKQGDNSFLLDSALNYGANTNNDAALPYVLRGLFGKYNASIKAENFFRISAMYQEFQMRDMWEYELQISNYQKDLITAFTYEMLEKEYKYFFLSDNCAYRINRIIGLAVADDPMPNLPWFSPIDLLHGLKKNKLINNFTYFPSQHTKAISSIRSLSPKERDTFYNFQHDKDNLTSLSNKTKNALIEDLNFQKLKAFKEGDKQRLSYIDNRRKNVLLNLNETAINNLIQPPAPPSESNLPTRVNHKLSHINKANNEESLTYYVIGLRGSNFSLLENDDHRIRNSEFKFLSPELSLSRHGPRIHKLTLFKILSINDRDFFLRNENSFSWGVDIGRKQINGACYPCGQNYASGQLGKGIYINPSTTLSLLSNFTIHDNKLSTGTFSTGLSFIFIKRNKKSKFLLKYLQTNYTEFDFWDDESYSFSFENTFSKSNGLNITFEKNKFSSEISLSYRKFY